MVYRKPSDSLAVVGAAMKIGAEMCGVVWMSSVVVGPLYLAADMRIRVRGKDSEIHEDDQ